MTCPNSDIKLFMRLEPDIPKLTHQNGIKARVVNGHAQVYKTPALRDLEAKYISLLKRFAPTKPWTCPTHLTTMWYFRGSAKVTTPYWKTTRPDDDNLIKTLKDCMTRCGFFKDDSFCSLTTIGKMVVPPSAPHGVEIRLHDLTNDEP